MVKKNVLILGSGPNVVEVHHHDLSVYDEIIAINNAWRVLETWTELIYPYDFPDDRKPVQISDQQKVVTETDFVDVQNQFGGFVYAGATMAFTALYWALGQHRPVKIDVLGCDMVYDDTEKTHFYGKGTADPLRDDITLRNLNAKSARFFCIAMLNDCSVSNLSIAKSRLVFPRSDYVLNPLSPEVQEVHRKARDILTIERTLGYFVESGRYWESDMDFDTHQMDAIDQRWLVCANDLLRLIETEQGV